MYAMGLLLILLLGWNFSISMWVCAGIQLVYILLCGLTSAMYNEVLQFFLIVLGGAPRQHLKGLVYSQTPRFGLADEPWYRRPLAEVHD